MTWVNIKGLVDFAPNWGVLVKPKALDVSAEELRDVIHLAYSHIKNKYLAQACHGGYGPLSGYGEVSFEDFLRLIEEARIAEAGQLAKRRHSKIRRSKFNTQRSGLVLAMIEANIRHVCAHPECDVVEDLTVDHIIPLSRGGTDELTNLQFLCRSHNSVKGDKYERRRHITPEIEANLDQAAYRATPEELAGIDRGLRAATDGNLVSDEEVEAVFAKHR